MTRAYRHRIIPCLLTLSLILSICGCLVQERRLIRPTAYNTIDKSLPFLKAHMLDGKVYILSDWQVDNENNQMSGSGDLQDINREILATGALSFSLDSVAIFESNVIRNAPQVATLGVITVLSAAMSLHCAINPKACFGSCPTFYADDGEGLRLQAEGFSASVAPFLEASDVDALFHARPENGVVRVFMRNEALETHVVRYVDLLAVPKAPDSRVFASVDGDFWQSTDIVPPDRAVGPEGNLLELVLQYDSIERTSRTDSSDLAAKETLEFDFTAKPDEQYGLVLVGRQTLLTTYLFYQSLAYMGRSTGQWFAGMQRDRAGAQAGFGKIKKALGGIDVLLLNDKGQWEPVGEVFEVGPLATNVHMLTLPSVSEDSVRIKLRMTQGMWRLDQVVLAQLSHPVAATRISPTEVWQNGLSDEAARGRLIDRDLALTTLPGDEYTLVFQLPAPEQSYEFFLESRGFYLEWIRHEWLAEENAMKALMFFKDPRAAFKELAPQFKALESDMESVFWNSRYAK